MKRAPKSAPMLGGAAVRPGAAASPPHEAALRALLAEIAAGLGASGCGLAMLRDDRPVALAQLDGPEPPWEHQPALIHAVRDGSAVRHTEDGHWLLAPVWLPHLLQPWVLWAERVIAWSDSELASAGAIAVDLARRLQTCCAVEIEAARATAFMDQAAWMSGRLVHDFGNILTGILGFTELTLAQLTPETPAHRYLTEVWQSARSGASWVHQLQLFGRREATNHKPASLTEALHQQAAQAEASGVRVSVSAPKQLPTVAMEAEALRQLLGQLLANACEACADGGAITITARSLRLGNEDCVRWLGRPRSGAAVQISVADTGMGLTPAAKEKVFRQMFFSTKPRHRGLGLAVAYGLVRAYQGGLRLETNEPRGTIAHVVLPCAAAPASVAGVASRLLRSDANGISAADAVQAADTAGLRTLETIRPRGPMP